MGRLVARHLRSRPSSRDGFGPLRHRQFRRFFAGESFSTLGDGMFWVVLAFAVLEETGSPADLGFVFAAWSLPFLVFLLAGGVIADRWSRRFVMITCDLIRFASSFILAILIIVGSATLWEILISVVIRASATAFFEPAVIGLTPLTVPALLLPQANALRGIGRSAGSMLGPALGGVLVAVAGPGVALAVDSGTFAVSAICLSLLRLPDWQPIKSDRFDIDLREGWRAIRTRTWLLAAISSFGLSNVLTAPFFVLGPFVAEERLGGPSAWAATMTALNLGGFAGGALALRLRPRRPLLVAFACFIPEAVPSVLLATHAPIQSLVVGALVAGAGVALGNALWETTLQRHIPMSMISRVSSYDALGSGILQPVGNALVGPTQALVGTSPVLWGSSAGLAAIGTATLLFPAVRRLEATPAVDPDDGATDFAPSIENRPTNPSPR